MPVKCPHARPPRPNLLKTLVERYIVEGQPVGSRVLSRQPGLELSPATIRNVMADLEELGYIASPHTSAGRIPTSKGYRFFVDSLMVMKPLEQVEIHRLEGEFIADRPQQLINAAATLLSQLTHFAGVVMTPKRREASFRHLEFLRLSERRVLLIIVTSEGDVQNRILHTGPAVHAVAARRGDQFLQPALRGPAVWRRALAAGRRAEVAARGHRRPDDGRGRGGRRGARTKARRSSSPARRTCSPPPISRRTWTGCGGCSISSSRRPRSCTCSTSRSGRRACRSTSAANPGLVPLDECSVVTAPYELDGRVIGTLGVIGPTRMAYERVIPIVDITAKLLSNALTHQMND